MNTNHNGIGMTSQRTRDRLIKALRDQGIKTPEVLEIMRTTPRHLFMDEAMATRAYENTALPIGHGQKISQPYIVARMTEALLEDGPLERVLEVGTGSGYQTAILARLATKVYSVERIEPLQLKARRLFRKLGLRNIYLQHADGFEGWPENAPFDGILVTAAPEEIPPSLLEQLGEGGRLIVPVGTPGNQQLTLIKRTADGYKQRRYDMVSFVPLVAGKA